MPDKDLQDLADDIRQNGLREPITLTQDGLLVDGKNRWDGCQIAGVEPRTVVYEGDPFNLALSRNKDRPHMSKSQMALAVARVANLRRGTTEEELSKQSGVTSGYIGYARRLLKQAEPHIIKMVDDGEVTVRIAGEAARMHSRSEQAAWTKDDVQREGNKVIKSYPSNQSGAKPRRSKQEPSKRIDIPYRVMQWPTREELQYPPVGSSVAEYDAYFKKYGRTPLHAKAIKEMLDAEGLTSMLAMGINSIAHERHPNADRFFEYIDHLLTHVREPDTTNGAQTDFAGKARKTLAMVEAALPKALVLLNALDAKLRARWAGRGTKDAEALPTDARG